MLVDDIAQVYFSNASIRVGLAFNGAEVVDRGYSPQQPAMWDVNGPVGTAKVVFGPFQAQVEFNEVLLTSSEGTDRVPLPGGVVTYVPGMAHHQRVTVVFDG